MGVRKISRYQEDFYEDGANPGVFSTIYLSS
jgi:hypothetical protein